jgi:hypothetical protein
MGWPRRFHTRGMMMAILSIVINVLIGLLIAIALGSLITIEVKK